MSNHYFSRFHGRKAIVIGGSMGGLVAARALADHFDEVIVVERDAIPDELNTARKGVPQGKQLHALLARGEQTLNEFFPGLSQEMLADGATHVNFSNEVAWFHGGGWKTQCPTDVRVISASRPLLESHVRRRLFTHKNVKRMDQTDVLGLVTTPDKSRVNGLRLRRREDQVELIEENADLVVDASGRGSKMGPWLEEIGYSRPEETTVKVHVGYAGRIYQAPKPWPHPWKILYILGAAPDSRRLGALFPIENDRFIVALGGLLDDHPAADHAGFMEFAKGLPNDTLYRVLTDCQPVSDIQTYKFPAHQRRHYERLSRIPDGLAVVGDAFASFNPIFGQGMTTACIDAVVLRNSLSEQTRQKGARVIDGFTKRYHHAAAKATLLPWLMSTGEDFRYPEVEGQRPAFYPAMKWYTGLVHRAAQSDSVVYGRFLRAMHMLGGLEELVNPSVLWRVLRANLANDEKRGAYPFLNSQPAPSGS